jgi:hypothetical protein
LFEVVGEVARRLVARSVLRLAAKHPRRFQRPKGFPSGARATNANARHVAERCPLGGGSTSRKNAAAHGRALAGLGRARTKNATPSWQPRGVRRPNERDRSQEPVAPRIPHFAQSQIPKSSQTAASTRCRRGDTQSAAQLRDSWAKLKGCDQERGWRLVWPQSSGRTASSGCRELAPEASAEQLIDPGGGVRGHDRRGRRGGVAVSTEIRLG